MRSPDQGAVASTRSALIAAAVATLGALAPCGGAWAVDPPPAAGVHRTDRLGPARAAIADARWDDALRELRDVDDPGSADWHNLMGFALRKRSAPDLAAAQRHYDAALRIDPDHRGALEYAGELALTKGDPAAADAYLRRLVRLCPDGCEERDDLERAMAAFRAGRGGARP